MERKATEGVDGRFTKNDRWVGAVDKGQGLGANRKEAEVFLGAGRQAVPGVRGGAAQFGAHRKIFFSQQQENGVALGVGIDAA